MGNKPWRCQAAASKRPFQMESSVKDWYPLSNVCPLRVFTRDLVPWGTLAPIAKHIPTFQMPNRKVHIWYNPYDSQRECIPYKPLLLLMECWELFKNLSAQRAAKDQPYKKGFLNDSSLRLDMLTFPHINFDNENLNKNDYPLTCVNYNVSKVN